MSDIQIGKKDELGKKLSSSKDEKRKSSPTVEIQVKVTDPQGFTSELFIGQDADSASYNPSMLDDDCRWGPIYSTCCNRCRNPKVLLFVMSCASTMQGVIVNGLINVNISTLERRFGLTSTRSGFLASTYDFASLVCLIPVGHFGGRGSKPIWLGLGVCIIGIGSLVFTLPHFLTGLYTYELKSDTNLCGDLQSADVFCSTTTDSDLQQYQYFLFAGQALAGVGSCPLYTLGTAFIDESISSADSALYIGIYYGMSILGPGLGYLCGGSILELYVDFDEVSTDNLPIDSTSSSWVGAWWLGFFVAAILTMPVGLMLLGFPARLPGARTQNVRRKSSHSVSRQSSSVTSTSHSFFGTLIALICNPTFVLLSAAVTADSLLIDGFASFIPKYVQSQYGLSAGNSGIVVGGLGVVAGAGGTILGGYITKRRGPTILDMLRLCIILNAIVIIFCFCFLATCESIHYAGLNVAFHKVTKRLNEPSLQHPCNQHCNCSTMMYDSICSSDHVVYFNPCIAGCANYTIENQEKVYYNCSCIQERDFEDEAKSSNCLEACDSLYVFLPLFAVVMFCVFMASIPALSATLRCVPDGSQSLALSTQWILVRCGGAIPGPILFGYIFDKNCIYWSQLCEGDGSCQFYDNQLLSVSLLVLSLIVKTIALLNYYFARFYHKSQRMGQNINIAVGTVRADHARWASQRKAES